MNIEQEIRAQIEKNKGLKLEIGYINNHLSILEGLLRNERADAQKQVNEAYQRGLQDGKDYYEQGCEGCKYEANRDHNAGICAMCRNSYKNLYERKDADDKIKIGDEVEWDNDFTGDRFIVTRIYQPYGKKEQCDGIDDDGDVCRAVLIESLVKTGRHFDIMKILEEMRT